MWLYYFLHKSCYYEEMEGRINSGLGMMVVSTKKVQSLWGLWDRYLLQELEFAQLWEEMGKQGLNGNWKIRGKMLISPDTEEKGVAFWETWILEISLSSCLIKTKQRDW